MKRPAGYDAPARPALPTPRSPRGGWGRGSRPPRATEPGSAAAARSAARLLRRASRDRRRAEKAEVRRFTKHARRRRAVAVTLLGALVAVVAAVAIAVFSPMLALRTIEVQGTERLAAADVEAALADQLGTPLPQLDFAAIERGLERFPMIETYVTESRPPDTLVVRIVERTPIALVRTPAGFDLVDSAGVRLASAVDRAPGYPIVELPDDDVSAIPFTSAAAVLVALPADLVAQVDSITARTTDDVSLVLTGGQRVVWGNDDDSATKAAHLRALLLQAPTAVQEYDVSSPGVGILR
ncbi:MAG TPA: FtsQ-type POTRA domain-containing protein [Naasia sp.]